jgi:hypothetical protein
VKRHSVVVTFSDADDPRDPSWAAWYERIDMRRDRKNSLVRPVVFTVAALLVAVGTATVSAPVVEANTLVCAEGDSGKIDTTNEPKTVTVTAPDGKLISGYCVKAGTEALSFVVEPPVKTLVIDHPNKDSVSHYSLTYVDVCEFDATLPVGHPDCAPPTTTLPPTTTTTTTLPPTTTTTPDAHDDDAAAHDDDAAAHDDDAAAHDHDAAAHDHDDVAV